MMTGSTNTHVWKTATYSGDYPSTFGTPAGYDNSATSIYATYTATTPMATSTPTPTPKPTASPTPTSTPMATSTPTPTPKPTASPTPTSTPMATSTPTPTLYTFGNTVVGTITNLFATDRDASRFQLTQSGVLQSITAYFRNAGFNAKAAIYTDNNGGPSTLIAQSSIQAITASGWQTFAVPSSLTAGYYWLCVVSSSSSSAGATMMTGSTNTHVWKTATYSGDYPSTFGTPAGYDNSATSIYATYTATTPMATSTPTPTPKPTASPTPTSTPMATSTPTPTPKPTASPTPTSTPMATSTPTPTPKPTASPTPTSTPMATSTPTPTPKPTSGLSPLHVDGTRLKDANGNVVVLRGVVYSSSQWWGDAASQCTEQQFIYMKNMGCNMVSISIQDYSFDKYHGENCYNNANFWSDLDNIMKWTYARGLYVNLRFWATSGADVHGHQSNDLGIYMKGDSGHFAWTEWLSVANTISYRYRNYNHIIYEPLSEGLNVPLASYVSHMQNCIDTIRANNPNAIVNVQAAGPPPYDWASMTFNMPSIGRSNLVWSWDPYGFWNTNSNTPNGVYSTVMYAGGRGPALILAAGGCVVFSEFGGKEIYDSWSSTWVKNFMAMCDANGVSGYTAFRWCTASSDSFNLLTAWNGNLSTFGNDIKTYYSAHR